MQRFPPEFGEPSEKHASAFVSSLLALSILGVWQHSQAQARGAWSDLFGAENGLNGAVHAIAIDNTGNVFAGGSFTTAGTVPANNIAQWTGSEWKALGNGFDDVVYALAIGPAGEIYAGGVFTASGAVPTERIARWNGTAWEALASSFDNRGTPGAEPAVFALGVDALGLVYVGGDFTEIDGVEAKGIAVWDGTAWRELGGGFEGAGCVDAILDNVWSIEVAESEGVYVVGTIENASGMPVNGIARWTGSAWQTLGSGVDVSSCAAVLGVAVHHDFEAVYPNPFKQETTIRFSVPSGMLTVVKLEVYDALGRRTAVLLDRPLPPGQHSVPWRAALLPAGVYTLRLQVGHDIRTHTIVKSG